jgi:hypothetical protein
VKCVSVHSVYTEHLHGLQKSSSEQDQRKSLSQQSLGPRAGQTTVKVKILDTQQPLQESVGKRGGGWAGGRREEVNPSGVGSMPGRAR